MHQFCLLINVRSSFTVRLVKSNFSDIQITTQFYQAKLSSNWKSMTISIARNDLINFSPRTTNVQMTSNEATIISTEAISVTWSSKSYVTRKISRTLTSRPICESETDASNQYTRQCTRMTGQKSPTATWNINSFCRRMKSRKQISSLNFYISREKSQKVIIITRNITSRDLIKRLRNTDRNRKLGSCKKSWNWFTKPFTCGLGMVREWFKSN